jgi:hypothetical protein
LNTSTFSDDQVVIAVCVVLAVALGILAMKLSRRNRKPAAYALLLVDVFLIAIIWFFSTFQIRLM